MRGVVEAIITILSVLLSLVAVWIIGVHWLAQGRELSERTNVIESPQELAEFIDDRTASGVAANFSAAPPVEVPTGLFIQSLVFNSTSDVNVTGYIWQKYPADFPFRKGVTFPEQIQSGSTLIREEYTGRTTHHGQPHDLIGYYFDVTVRQTFDYRQYPLDFLTIWLRLWPAEFADADRIVLVPDFDSYEDISAGTFGLDADLVQGEWEIDRSFFSYQAIPYDTDFGFRSDGVAHSFEELHFNLGVTRKFVNAFVINLVPLLVVAVLLFAGLMTVSSDERQSQAFGFNTSGLLATCSALFFVVLLSHVQVRGMFPGSGLVYIEYFYLVMYMMILATALNGYLFTLQNKSGLNLLRYHDNYIAKVTFWPLLLWSLVFVTQAVLG